MIFIPSFSSLTAIPLYSKSTLCSSIDGHLVFSCLLGVMYYNIGVQLLCGHVFLFLLGRGMAALFLVF